MNSHFRVRDLETPTPLEREVSSESFTEANQAKASFDAVYDASTPAAYLSKLAPLGYCIPDVARSPVLQLLDSVPKARDRVTVLDVGCSYGINAAVLKYGTSFRALSERFAGRDAANLATRDDGDFFARLPRDPRLRVIGLDAAPNAVRYACETGLLDDGISVNLEADPLSAADAERLTRHPVDLILSTGCVGYVTELTFEKLLDTLMASGARPAVACFVLRMFPYDDIAQLLEKRGLGTRKMPGTFRQRRFESEEERREVFRALRRLGLDPGDAEARDGFLHAELFVSRPR